MSRETIDPAEEARFDAELWFGWPGWPVAREMVSSRSVEPWDGVGLARLPTGGFHCVAQEFFGLAIHLPAGDELACLAAEFYGTNLPGNLTPGEAAPLPEILELRERLEELELELDPMHFVRFAEAYVPVEGRAAWGYVRRRKLKVFRHADDDGSMVEPEQLRLWSWEDVGTFLDKSWKLVQQELGAADRGNPRAPAVWTAVLHYPNSE